MSYNNKKSFAESIHLSELGFDTVSETDYGGGADEDDIEIESSTGFSLIGERIEPSEYDNDDDIPSMFDEFLELPGPGLHIGKSLEVLEAEALDLTKDSEVQSFCPKCCASYSPPPLTQNLPKLLPCLHTFCSECVISMIKRDSKYKKRTATILECPTCHLKMTFKDTSAKSETYVKEMKNDPAVFNIFKAALVHRLGDLEDIEYNEYICYRCSQSGKTGKGTGKPLLPKYDDVDNNNNNNFCENNENSNKPRSRSAASVRDMVDSVAEKEELNFNDIAHCVECDKVVCLQCAVFGKCKNHNMRYVVEAANDTRKELNLSLDLVMPTIDKLLAAKYTVAHDIDETLKRSNILKAHVYNAIDEIVHVLRNREEELLEIVDRFTDRKIDELNKEKNKITEYIIKTMASYKYAKSLTLFGSDTQILDIRHMLFRRLSVVSNINYSLNVKGGSASYVSIKNTPLDLLKFLCERMNIIENGDPSKTVYITDDIIEKENDNDIGIDSLHIPKPVIFRPSSRPSFLLIFISLMMFAMNSIHIFPGSLSLPTAIIVMYKNMILPFSLCALTLILIISIIHDMICDQGYQWLTSCYVNSDDFNKRAEKFKDEMNKVNLFFIKSKTKATLKSDENVLLSERINRIQNNRTAQITEYLSPYQEQNMVMEELYKKKHQQYMIALALEEEERIQRKSREIKEKKMVLPDLKKKKISKINNSGSGGNGGNSSNIQKKSYSKDLTKKNKKSSSSSSTDKKKDVSSTVTNLKFNVKGFSNPNSTTSQPSKNSSAATAASLIMSSQLQSGKKVTLVGVNVPTYNKFSKNEDIDLKRKQHEEKIFGSKYNNDSSNFAISDFEDNIHDIVDDIDNEEIDSPTWKQSIDK